MTAVPSIGGFSAPAGSDYAGFTYDEDKVTAVTYKQGGGEGDVMGVLNISYDDSNNVTAVYWS